MCIYTYIIIHADLYILKKNSSESSHEIEMIHIIDVNYYIVLKFTKELTYYQHSFSFSDSPFSQNVRTSEIFVVLKQLCTPDRIHVGMLPLPVTVTTRMITCLVGDLYKPSFATGSTPKHTLYISVHKFIEIKSTQVLKTNKFLPSIINRRCSLPHRIQKYYQKSFQQQKKTPKKIKTNQSYAPFPLTFFS